MFEPYEQTIKSLNKFSPQSIYGMPGYFFRLAQKMSETNIKIPSIKQIYTSSEYLQNPVRQYIQEIFNAEVFDIYGSTEFKEVAWECEKHEGYHINEDSVIVEVLNNGIPAEPGVIGNIVLTDLRNTVMPLIRYQMHDKGVLLNKKCSCGRTFSLMKPCAGRSSEYIILPGGEELSPYLFTTNIECIDGLLQYQVVQLTMEKLIVHALTTTSDFEHIAFQIHKILSGVLNHRMKIEVRHCTKLDIEENGKFKVIKNLCMK
jgi:phenylacetate-CoA ligase